MKSIPPLSLLLCTILAVNAVPVAVNDSYTTSEDTVLYGGSTSSPLLTADFEPAGGGSNLASGTWQYLDKIKNDQNGQTPNGYPTDSEGAGWKDYAFETTSSSVPGWQSSALPIQGGGINALSGAAELLTGMSAGAAPYSISTYLFRHTFTADAATAALAQWTLHSVVDDGAIFYLNGQEIARVAMSEAELHPAGPVTTLTLTNTNGNEDSYTDQTLDLAGKLKAGNNVLAVEVHQTFASGGYNSSDAGLSFTLSPASSDQLSGLVYADDVYNSTNRPNSVTGALDNTNGNPGSSVYVAITRGFGGGSGANVSGGWRKTITVPTAGTVQVKADARAVTANGLEDSEYSEAFVLVDGTRYSPGGSSYLVRAVGANPAASPGTAGNTDSGWATYTMDIPLTAGAHVFTFGGFGPRPSNENGDSDESAAVLFDNISVTLPLSGGAVLANDTGGATAAILVGTTENGTLTLNANGGFIYTPALNFNGTDTFTYRASDGTSQSDVATVTLTINSVNDLPMGVVDAYTTDEGSLLSVPVATGVLVNDTDVDSPAASLTAIIGTTTPNGTLKLNANGSFSYTPKADFSGTDTFTYRASDGTGESAPTTVTITVNNINSVPVSVNDTYTALKNTPLVVTALTPSSVTEEVFPLGAADWHYLDALEPAKRNLGTAWRETSYAEDDDWQAGAAELGFGDGDEATVINDNPDPAFVSTATDKFATSYFRRRFTLTDFYNITGAEISLLFDDACAFYLNGTPAGRTSNLPTMAAMPELAWDYFQTGQFNDNATQTFNIPASLLVDGQNLVAAEVHQSAPNSSDLSFDMRLRVTRATPAGVLANDADPDPGAVVTVNGVVTPPAHGSVTLNANGTFTYSPTNGYTGPDSFTYRAKDEFNVLSNIATVSITVVSGPNVAPVANGDSYNAVEDTTLAVNAASGVLTNDTDAEGDPFTAVIAAQAAHGIVTLNPDGSFVYAPAANFNGSDSFTYRANDGKASVPALVSIVVAAVNDPPVATVDNYSGDPGQTLSIAAGQGLLANDIDVDTGTVLAAELVSPPASGTLILNGDGSFTFSAATGGVYSFSYRAKDSTSQSAPATVTLSLNAAPAAVAENYTTAEDTPFSVAAAQGVLANDTDAEGQPLTAQLVATAQHGSLTLNANGSFTFSPAANFSGADSFTYRAFDGIRQSAVTTVSLNITPVNDAPVAVNDTYGAGLDTPLIVSSANGVLANDSDPDNPVLAVQMVSTTTHGVLALNADGSFIYTPATGYLGPDSFSYRAADSTLTSSTATASIFVSGSNSVVKISEIMYNPPSGINGEEFIELHNIAAYPVDLSGWKFTSGVDFAIPAGRVLAGGAYLVIPANATAFAAKYPGVTAYVSPGWGATSGLSNSGEKITLVDNQNEKIDEVHYYDSGEWAERRIVNVWDHTNTPGNTPANGLDTDPSLEWYTTADPDPEIGNTGGHSIQVRNPALSNNEGQNWGAGVPTPGAANAAVSLTNSAPVIKGVKHSPAVPDHNQQVTVTAKLEDEAVAGLSASVLYRTWLPSGQTPATAFVEVAMADDGKHGDGIAGDSEFGAALPAQALGTVVEFYVSAKDAQNNVRTWPTPTLDVNGANPQQDANCLYQVDEEVWSDSRPLYRLVTTGAENYRYDVQRWNAQSNEALNCTFIASQGRDTDIRYGCSVRVRGNSSRSWNPRNWRLDLPGDRSWNGRSAFTLNTKYVYSQYLASRFMESGGIPVEHANLVGVRLNAANHALDSNQNGTFGYYVDITPMGGELIAQNFPYDSGGNGYSKIRGSVRFGASTLPVIGPDGYAVGGYVNEGWTKKSNAPVNDWTDLDAWLQAVNNSTAANFDTSVASSIDIDQWARWWAMSTIINHAETNPANGDDDDYSIYCGELDRRAKIIAHDFDTCFNLRDINLGDENAPPTATIYQATENNYPANDGATIPQMDKFYRNPVTGRKFKAALRYYLDTLFIKSNFDAMVDAQLPPSLMGSTLPNGNPVTPTGDAIRAHLKSFMDTRRATIATFLPTAFTAATTLTVQNGFPRTTSATALGALGGAIDPARTAKVTVNGITVTHSPYDNNWSAGAAITLAPGLNQLVCTAWDEKNAIVDSRTLTIWYDAAGASKSGTLAGSETWTSAGGPYNVTASLTVPNGATLTISPGASVFLASGASITVASGGRLMAEGTPAAPIRIDRAPAATADWANIVINGGNGSPECRLANLIIDHNSSVAIHTQSAANVVIDRVTFLNTAVGYISLDGSSFTVSNCTFPTATAGFELVHGTGGIAAGGHGIVRDCVFGRPTGYNDSFDFTGGNRPGPILQVLNCIFNGSDDDILDLDSTDAWIEGNVFMHCHRNGSSPDSSSGVSGGADNADFSQVTVIRNLFYDCDNAVTMKQGNQPNGNSAVLLFNTIVHITKTGGIDTGSGVVNFDDDNVNGEGKGMYLEGNIIQDVENLTRNYDPALSQLTLINNILPSDPPATAASSGNTIGDPLLNLPLITNPATATAEQVIAALTPQSCSPALGTGPLGKDKGAGTRQPGIAVQGPPVTIWPANVTLPVGPGGSFTPTSQAAWNYGYTHYKYSLDSGAESPEAPVNTPLSLTGLANGAHTLSVWGKNDAGSWQDAATVVAFKVNAAAPTVVLNEVLANNITAFALGTTHPDVIELQNYGTAAVNVGGWTLSDDSAIPDRYTITADTMIPAGGFLAIMADSLPSQLGEQHAGFGLSSGGETVSLYKPGAVPVDAITFGPQMADYSVGRSPATSEWTLCVPSVGLANTPYCNGFASGATLRINEWLATNDIIVDSDFVELHNPAAQPVNLGGYALTDDFTNYTAARAAGDGSVYVIPPLSFIAAGGFTAFRADGGSSPDTLTFGLSKLHETLGLVAPDGQRIDHVIVDPGLEDRSEGRMPDGGSITSTFSIPTPGLSNGTNVSSETDLLNGLRITEIMFDPASSSQAEYIEFKNIGATPLTLTGVNFASGIVFTFPVITVAPGAYTVITSDLARFQAQFPGVPAQWASGRLDNNGEALRIETAAYALGILDFRYEGDWYPEIRYGAALEIIDPTAARSTWGERENWQPCVPSPGGPSVFGVIAPQDITVVAPAPAVLHAFVCPGPLAASGITVLWSKVSGPGSVVFNAPASKDTDATFTAPGIYELRIAASGPGVATEMTDTMFVTVAESYSSWAAARLGALPPAQQAGTADPDRDGLLNLVEYVMATDPVTRTAGPELIRSNSHLALRYPLSKLLDPAIQVIPQISSDMNSWASLNSSISVDGATVQTRIAEDPSLLGAGTRKFLRLKVVSP